MKLDRVIAVRNNKTIYRDGDKCVKVFNEIISLKKELRPTMPWIIHGFRGKPKLTRQLLDNGFYISLGEHFNLQSVTIIPTDHLLFETDESTLDIDTIIKRIKYIL